MRALDLGLEFGKFLSLCRLEGLQDRDRRDTQRPVRSTLLT